METDRDGTIHSLPPKSDAATGINGSAESGAPNPGEASAEGAPVAKAAPEEVELTREEVLGAVDTRRMKVQVDEWKEGGFVWVQTPTAADRDYLERVIVTGTNPDGSRRIISKEEVRASVIALSVVNADGTRKFKPEDITALSKKSIVPIERLYQAIISCAIITEADVEELAKNSGAASNGIS